MAPVAAMSRDMLLGALVCILDISGKCESFTESLPPRSATLMTHWRQMPSISIPDMATPSYAS
jgi:hypothetical protein